MLISHILLEVTLGIKNRSSINYLLCHMLQVLLGIFFFPAILFLKYRSREELELMPQTFEEHLQELYGSDSDSGSDSGAASETSRTSAGTSSTGKKKKGKSAEEQQQPPV